MRVHSFPCTLAIVMYCLIVGTETWPQVTLKALRLWVQMAFAFLNLFMSETFHTEESLSNQIYLAELLLSALSNLTFAVCKVMGPKGGMSLWREWWFQGIGR